MNPELLYLIPRMIPNIVGNFREGSYHIIYTHFVRNVVKLHFYPYQKCENTFWHCFRTWKTRQKKQFLLSFHNKIEFYIPFQHRWMKDHIKRIKNLYKMNFQFKIIKKKNQVILENISTGKRIVYDHQSFMDSSD